VAASCAHGPAAVAPAPRLPEAKARDRRTPPPPEWFWEPVDADVHPPARKPIDLPLAESTIGRIEGAARLWDDLPSDARERLRRDGVLVLGASIGAPNASVEQPKQLRSMGAFYMHLREQRIPHLITLDALFAMAHVGLVRALAQVEDAEVAPALHSFLEKVDARLAAEEAGAGTELLDAYRLARGVVAVARALEGATQGGAALEPAIAAERANIEGHAGPATSPLLGVVIDYSQFAPPSAAARPGSFRALAWLGAAPFTLVARSEAHGAPIGIGRARTNARAAMLLARICDRDVDAAVSAAYGRLVRLFSFVWGAPDDLSLTELDDLAEAGGIDLTKPENIANVVRVDKVRTRAAAVRLPRVYDGSGVAERGGINVRLFGGHASADSVVLQSLVGPRVGLAHEAAAASDVDRLRKGQRVLPSTLDIAAWLGAPEARPLLHESNADVFDAYDQVLAALQQVQGERGTSLHASVFGSLLDALIAWANAAPSVTGVARTPAADRMRVESLLSAWTLARHAGQAMARPRPAPSSATAELRVSGAALPVFVEPMPDVVARLVAVVRQLRRGLAALGGLAPTSGASTTLVEIEDILRIALKGAERHANDEATTSEEAAALASLPARMARLEGGARADDSASDDVGPVVAVIYSDPPSRRVLASATGRIEPALMLARDPNRDEPVLVAGAHVAHHEIVEGFEPAPGVLHAVRPPITDASWRARLENSPHARPGVPPAPGSPDPPATPATPATPASSKGQRETRPSWVAAFRWTR
jgi:Protein of unknown function (DUF3160)